MRIIITFVSLNGSSSFITTDGTNLYFTSNDGPVIRKIVISTRQVSIIAGTLDVWGSADGIGGAAQFYCPSDITTDGTTLYVADCNHNIRKIVISTSEVTTLAGSAGNPGWADGFGLNAQFYSPGGITTDGTNLYVSDYNNHKIRKINIATGEVLTVASRNMPGQIVSDGLSLFVMDVNYHRIVQIQ